MVPDQRSDTRCPRTVAYVSSAETKEIIVLTLDPENGDIIPVEKVGVPGTDRPSPTSMPLAISPDRRFLYAALRSAPFPVSSFEIDPHGGHLTHVATVPLPDNMAYIATDRTGCYLFAASYVGAKLTVNSIGPRGDVQAPAIQVVETLPKAHCILSDGSNRFVYATSLAGDIVMQQEFDATTGRLVPLTPAIVQTKRNAGPRHHVLSPSGRFLYLLNELAGC